MPVYYIVCRQNETRKIIQIISHTHIRTIIVHDAIYIITGTIVIHKMTRQEQKPYAHTWVKIDLIKHTSHEVVDRLIR